MSISQSESRAHDTAANAAEMTRQVADNAARATFLAGGTQAAYNAAIKANAITYFRAVIASAVANGINAEVFRQGLSDPTIALQLTADEVPPGGWWTLQEKLKQAMDANPVAAAAINAALEKTPAR